MINLNSLTQSITAAIGALILSTTFVAAAVGPAAVPASAQAPISAQAHA